MDSIDAKEKEKWLDPTFNLIERNRKMGWMSRRPNSNDPPSVGESPYGGNEMVDGFALLLSGDGARCKDCQQVIRNKFLEDGHCPDCYRKIHGQESPALERCREVSARWYGGCASGEDGEAD